jgi:hypothetical protein
MRNLQRAKIWFVLVAKIYRMNAGRKSGCEHKPRMETAVEANSSTLPGVY